MYKLFDFYCEICDETWEDLVEDEMSICRGCGTETMRERICAAKLASFSLRDADSKRQELLRRSAEHTYGELRKNPEKFGAEGIRRAREGQIRSVGGLPKEQK